MPALASVAASALGSVGNLLSAQNVDAFSGLILVNPERNIGIESDPQGDTFVFHVASEDSVSLTSDITDHFVEDNTAIQDHIVLKPVMVNTSGFIGELNDVPPFFLAPLQSAANKLQLLTPYMPALSASAIIAYNNAFQTYQQAANLLGALKSITSAIGITTSENEQQKAFNKFYGWWKGRQLFKVQTPWAIFDSMAIQSIKATQGEDTRVITEFELTFKKINKAQSKTSLLSAARAGLQNATVSDNGTTTGTPAGTMNSLTAASGIA